MAKYTVYHYEILDQLRDGYAQGIHHALSVMQGSICGILHAYEGATDAGPVEPVAEPAPCHHYIAGAWQIYLEPYGDKFSVRNFAALYGFCPHCGEQLTEGGPGCAEGPEDGEDDLDR